MNAVEWLKLAAAAGLTDTYPCPCRAQGRLVELAPRIFSVTYEHDDDCPIIAGRAPGTGQVI